MRQISSLLFLPLFLISFSANALLIADTYVVEQQITADAGAGHIFELMSAGYSPTTDSITNIKLTYDFTEVYSPTNLGDEDEVPDDGSIDWPPYPNEFVIFSSWIFGWREVHGDIDTGLTVFETDWTRNDSCQFETAAIPGDDDTVYCALNIDLNGTMNAWVLSFTDNLWLHSIAVEIEVDRKVEVPEPTSGLLLGIGLLAACFLRSFKIHCVKIPFN